MGEQLHPDKLPPNLDHVDIGRDGCGIVDGLFAGDQDFLFVHDDNQAARQFVELTFTRGVVCHIANRQIAVAGEQCADRHAACIGVVNDIAQTVEVVIREHEHRFGLGMGEHIFGIAQDRLQPGKGP